VTGSTQDHDPSLIVPLIKRAEPEGYGDPPPWPIPEEDVPIFEDLTGHLLVSYVFDLPDWFQCVTPRDCQRLGLATEDCAPLPWATSLSAAQSPRSEEAAEPCPSSWTATWNRAFSLSTMSGRRPHRN
jgi:hypothetical protein